jgi:hypothetical protein
VINSGVMRDDSNDECDILITLGAANFLTQQSPTLAAIKFITAVVSPPARLMPSARIISNGFEHRGFGAAKSASCWLPHRGSRFKAPHICASIASIKQDGEALKLAIYEHRAWDGFLLPCMFPEALRISAEVGDSGADLLARLPDDLNMLAFHLPLTATAHFPLMREQFCVNLARRRVRVINELMTDISKRTLQGLCQQSCLPVATADRIGPPDEMLIVKTNFNYGGEAERALTVDERSTLGCGDCSTLVKDSRDYMVVERRKIPPAAWDDLTLVVERFITNAHNFFYRAYIGGASIAISRVVDEANLKKMPEGIERKTLFTSKCDLAVRSTVASVDSLSVCSHSILSFLKCCPLDFGAIDLVQDDEDVIYIIDVNTTPFWGETGHSEILEHLVNGLNGMEYLPPSL